MIRLKSLLQEVADPQFELPAGTETDEYVHVTTAEKVLAGTGWEDYTITGQDYDWPFPAISIGALDQFNKIYGEFQFCWETLGCYNEIIVYGFDPGATSDYVVKVYKWNGTTKWLPYKSLLQSVTISPEDPNKLANRIKSVAATLKRNGVTDTRIAAVILGVCAKESGFVLGTEQLHTEPNAQKLRNLFPPLQSLNDEQIKSLRKRPADFYEAVYGKGTAAGKNLGNTFRGDGWTYRGRGFNGITGRAVYKAVGYENNPSALETLEGATTALINYFKIYGLLTKQYSEETSIGDILKDYINANGGLPAGSWSSFIQSNYNAALKFIKNNLVVGNVLKVPGYPDKVLKV
jgi:predicted chitinase